MKLPAISQVRSVQARRWLRAGAYLVPFFYLAWVLWLQPSDELGEPERFPWLGRLVYDDYDPAARALRGLNAVLGRTPGLLVEPPRLGQEQFSAALDRERDRTRLQSPYFLEYPHGALILFRLGYVFGNRPEPNPIPVAVSDAAFHDLVEHTPRTEDERQIWRQLRRAIQCYAVIGAVCLFALMAVLHMGYESGHDYADVLYLLVLPASLYFSLNRFDVVPALLVALSLACLGRRWLALSACLLALATVVKVYPILLAPLFARYLCNRQRDFWTWSLAYAGGLATLLLSTIMLSGWTETWAPYRFQLSRELESWTLFGTVLPSFLGSSHWVAKLFRNGCLLSCMLALCRSRPNVLDGLLRRSAILLIIFVCLQVFYSPQWVLWFSPFLIPLARNDVKIRRFVVAFDLLTFLSFPVVYDLPDKPPGIQPLLGTLCTLARIAMLGIVVLMLGREEFKRPQESVQIRTAPA